MATRSSTPEAYPDVTAEMRTASPTSVNKAITRKVRDLPEHRLTAVVSQPTTRSEIQNLDAALYHVKSEETQAARSKTLPLRTSEKEPDGNRLVETNNPPAKAVQRAIGPLHQALNDEDTYKILSLLSIGTDVNELGRLDRTPLHVCALVNDKVTAQALLRTGRANLSARDIHDRTPLECALEVGNDGIACLLLECGANIEDVAQFIIEMTHRMRKPAEEKVAHACLAWLSKRGDLDMENRLINAMVAGSGSSTGSIARFLEGTPFREQYVQRSSLHTRSQSMDSRARSAGIPCNVSSGRLGVDDFFVMDAPPSQGKVHAESGSLSPQAIIQNSVLWRVSGLKKFS
jgi:hypothetical protein